MLEPGRFLPQFPPKPKDARFWPPFAPPLPANFPYEAPSASAPSATSPSPPKRSFRPVKRERHREHSNPFEDVSTVPPFLFPQQTQQMPQPLPPQRAPLDFAHHLLNAVFLSATANTPPTRDETVVETDIQKGEEYSQCSHCSKQFGTQHGLVVHMRRFVQSLDCLIDKQLSLTPRGNSEI